jgi:nitrogen fixation NifU-like protein
MFSQTVMEHFLGPRNVGELAHPSGEGWAGSPEAGRYMCLQVHLQGDSILEARYRTYGCAPAIAAGSLLTEWLRGRTVPEARALSAAELVAMLGGLPPERLFCADLALEALHDALDEAAREECTA